jgi:hypothetical protein
LHQVFDRPAASVNVALLVAVFAKVHSANLDYAAVGANYDVRNTFHQVTRKTFLKILCRSRFILIASVCLALTLDLAESMSKLQ